MNIKPIKTTSDYENSMARMDEIFEAKVGMPEADEADILIVLIDEFERKHFPIDAPDPIEAIKIRMEEMNLKQRDLIDVFGGKNRVSEILNRKRKLTIEMIRNLTLKLNLSANILIQDYQLSD
jgi:HTH-type transcriptional regulator/antitoxin HigA